jgi:hypothetical protein
MSHSSAEPSGNERKMRDVVRGTGHEKRFYVDSRRTQYAIRTKNAVSRRLFRILPNFLYYNSYNIEQIELIIDYLISSLWPLCRICYLKKQLHPVNEYMERTVWGLGVGSREKSFGQRLQFGQPGGKFEPLGPRTIFLGRRDRH